jgi:hypothetical protein
VFAAARSGQVCAPIEPSGCRSSRTKDSNCESILLEAQRTVVARENRTSPDIGAERDTRRRLIVPLRLECQTGSYTTGESLRSRNVFSYGMLRRKRRFPGGRTSDPAWQSGFEQRHILLLEDCGRWRFVGESRIKRPAV